MRQDDVELRAGSTISNVKDASFEGERRCVEFRELE